MTSGNPVNVAMLFGDVIDACDVELGAWFEARILKMTRQQRNSPATITRSDDDDSFQAPLPDQPRDDVSDRQGSTDGEHSDSAVLMRVEDDDDGFTYTIVFEQ